MIGGGGVNIYGIGLISFFLKKKLQKKHWSGSEPQFSSNTVHNKMKYSWSLFATNPKFDCSIVSNLQDKHKNAQNLFGGTFVQECTVSLAIPLLTFRSITMMRIQRGYLNIVIEILCLRGRSIFGRKSSKLQLFFNFDELVLEDAEIFFHLVFF